MESKEFKLTEKFLQEAIDKASSTLVGKLMKRFEITQNVTFLKSESKELVYEAFRDLRENLFAFGQGYEAIHFKFTSKESKEK